VLESAPKTEGASVWDAPSYFRHGAEPAILCGDPDFLYAALDTATCAAFITESRMKFVNANNSTGNPGERIVRLVFPQERSNLADVGLGIRMRVLL
jgi:hypothetical protein